MQRKLPSKPSSTNERQCGAEVEDVSNPHLKNGFDLRSKRPNGEIRYIEVKGRTGVAGIELTENEWRQAANHGKRYWLYTVYHCDANPQLYRCQDPFANLIATSKRSFTIHASDIMQKSEPSRCYRNARPVSVGQDRPILPPSP